jgi:hypothetical protein
MSGSGMLLKGEGCPLTFPPCPLPIPRCGRGRGGWETETCTFSHPLAAPLRGEEGGWLAPTTFSLAPSPSPPCPLPLPRCGRGRGGWETETCTFSHPLAAPPRGEEGGMVGPYHPRERSNILVADWARCDIDHSWISGSCRCPVGSETRRQD